jgi:thiosulfate/3-mercaptopyruvate sulfurtransferase
MFTTLIDPAQLADLIDRKGVRLFDCGFDLADPDAGRAAYLETHLPGARYLSLDRDLSSAPSGSNGRHPLPDPAVFAECMRRNGLHQGEQVVAYDASDGIFAARLWWMLRWLGHDAVAVLDGSRQAWVQSGGTMETGEAPALPSGDFTATPRANWIATADDILANIPTQAFTIIDARSAARFRGESNPMDPVSGHIPGARNRFYGDNLDASHRFKPAATLAAEFDAILGDRSARDLILQCGSGVTACHNALALEVMGRSSARLYPGSWSEWISDPQRPIA